MLPDFLHLRILAHHDACEQVTMPAQIFGGRMNDGTGLARRGTHHRNIDDTQIGVGRRFEEYGVERLFRRSCQRLWIGEIHELGVDEVW